MAYKDVLAYYLDKQGVSAAELARRIGSPRSTINALLKGRAKEPTLGKAKAIADALGVSLEEMARMTYEEGSDDQEED
jgi:transcriptional regulator with XRE-family HTH domain